jgi:hypothetical protein
LVAARLDDRHYLIAEMIPGLSTRWFRIGTRSAEIGLKGRVQVN